MDIAGILHKIAVIALPLIFAITLHEAAHGWVAMKFGDKTALMMGRVTLNPAKHIDWFGTIILPLGMLILSKFTMAFGWAKPVPVTWQNLRNPRRDMAIVALAGPFSNLLMALIWGGIARISLPYLNTTTGFAQSAAIFFFSAGMFGILINCILMLLNLIPIPPLDGSRVISSILPPRLARKYEKIEPYGIWILLGLLVFGFLGKILYGPLMLVASWIMMLLGLPTGPA